MDNFNSKIIEKPSTSGCNSAESHMEFVNNNLTLSTPSTSNSNNAAMVDNSSVETFVRNNKSDYDSTRELDVVSLSSNTSLDSVDESTKMKCAVVLCNENARNQFNRLFFINFPLEDLKLCDKWWTICGRNDKFDPQMKICSIHFNDYDFTYTYKRRDGQLYRQTVLKSSIVPTLYLQSHEYTKFIRKRKRNIEKTELQTISAEIINCAVKSCKNTFSSKDCKQLFFKFPMKNQLLLKQWIDNIELHDQQSLNNDRVCSDHFEKDSILNIQKLFILKKNAVPSMNPKNAFSIDSEIDSHSNSEKSIKPQNTECNISNQKLNISHDSNSKQKLVKKSDHSLKSVNPKMNKTKTLVASSTAKIISVKEEMLIPKSSNNGNDQDYIYLDALDYGHGSLLSFEKKYIPKSKPSEFLNGFQIKKPIKTPSSVINSRHLTEVYKDIQPAVCSSECQEFCYFCITSYQRKQVFEEFRKLKNSTEQNCKIVQLINLRTVKKSNGTFETYPSYNLVINDISVIVCRLFFMNTLGITEHRLDEILVSKNYSWFFAKETALKIDRPQRVRVVKLKSSNFVKNSLNLLEKDYSVFKKKHNLEVKNVGISTEEFEKVLNYIKSVPRILSMYKFPGQRRKQFFETTVDFISMYKIYSKSDIVSDTAPPCTVHQFKQIYNQYMKTFS